MSPLPEDYLEKVYAGWLGKCIGVRFGAPIENWTYPQIRDYLGEVLDYLPMPEGKIFQADDDTSLPMIFLRSVEDYGPRVHSADIGKALLNYLGDQHGSLWWGGYGASTEHTAYLNLKSGISPSLSGKIALNGETLAEQIGGQIFSDIWGLLVPDDPEKAARYAGEASSVTHDRNGIYGGMFVAAMVSAAFSCADPAEIIQKAVRIIPPDSEYARVVNAICDFHQKNPANWRDCCEFIHQAYGYDRYAGIVPIIPNAAVMVMGLLYGEGDFSRTIQITNMAGWDTDCNVGNAASVMGVAVGIEGIHSVWRSPQNDMFVAASILGADNILDIPTVAKRIVRMGSLIAGYQPHSDPGFRYDFDLPGATQGFKFKGPQRNILTVQQSRFEGKGVLKGVVRLLKKKQEMALFVDTCFHPQQLNSDYYAAGFSPKIYPGQKMQASLYLPPDAPQVILASLYVYDSRTGENLQGPAIKLAPGHWQPLSWTIPARQDACLSQAGLLFRNLGADTWRGVFYLDYLDWIGRPAYGLDFSHLPQEFNAAGGWTYLRGYWRLDTDGYHGSGCEVNESYSGDVHWDDLDIQVILRPLLGDQHGLLFRVQGALRSYTAAFRPGRLCLLKKVDGHYLELASTEYTWQLGESYQIDVQVIGNEFRLESGKAALTWKDEESPYMNGQIGVLSGAGCHTCFQEIHVR